jgi:hydroxymethylglutaryl-CoA lyase
MIAEAVTVCEVGPRDGLQSVQQALGLEQKMGWIDRLHAARLRAIEVGAYVSEKAVPQMRDSAAGVCRALRMNGLEVGALVANLRGPCAQLKMACIASAFRFRHRRSTVVPISPPASTR